MVTPSDWTGLSRAVYIQRRVIGALLMREIMTRYGRHNIGFLWLFVEPMLFTLAVAALWSATKATHGSNLPIIAFAVTGYSSILLWRNMPGRCIGAISFNIPLMYHRQVRVLDIYVSRLILEIGGATASFVTLTVFFIYIGWMKMPEDILQIIFGWIMLAWFGSALAITLGAFSHDYEIVDKLWHPFAYIMFPLSGAVFIVNALPAAGQYYVLFIPTVHAVEYIREGFFGSEFTAHYSMGYLAMFNIGLTAIGLARTRLVSARLILA